MRKSFSVVVLPMLAISTLALSACGMTRSQNQWKAAKQETPLEIPPGLDVPVANATLAIPPPGANLPTANGATARVGNQPGVITDAFVSPQEVMTIYRRMGALFANGELGKAIKVVAHDDAAHSYTLNVHVPTAPQTVKKQGFFWRLFDRNKSPNSHKGSAANSSADNYQVQLVISASGSHASEVRAQGAANAVAKVIDSLRTKLSSSG